MTLLLSLCGLWVGIKWCVSALKLHFSHVVKVFSFWAHCHYLLKASDVSDELLTAIEKLSVSIYCALGPALHSCICSCDFLQKPKWYVYVSLVFANQPIQRSYRAAGERKRTEHLHLESAKSARRTCSNGREPYVNVCILLLKWCIIKNAHTKELVWKVTWDGEFVWLAFHVIWHQLQQNISSSCSWCQMAL